jgi:hypothetical protein
MRPSLKFAFISALALASPAIADTDLERDHFIPSLRKADFIFEGVVTAVDYKSSRPAGTGARAMPHTFVTFEIHKVYKGNPGSLQTLTLRFLGGATGVGGRVLEVSGYPLFDVGDHDILLMERNTKKSCPLALCAQGRFRIINGLVYSDSGNEVDLMPDGAMAYGPEHRLPEIDTDMVGGHRMEKVIVEELPGGIAPPPQPPPPAGWRHMTFGAFDTFLEATLKANLSPGELARQSPVVSANIGDDFVFAVLRQALPSSDPGGFLGNLPVELVTSIQEQLELELFNANGGDPRL